MDATPVRYFTTSDGYSIAYSVAGQGRPLVFMPTPLMSHIEGSASPFGVFSGWRQGLVSNFRLIQFDGRGQGLSSRGLPDDMSMSHLALDLEELIDHLGLETTVIMAYGMTSHVAAHYVAQSPGRTEALILISSSLRNSVWPDAMWGALPREDWNSFLRSIAGGMPAFSVNFKERLDLVARNITQADWCIRYSAWKDSDLSDILPALRTPTLLIHPKGLLTPPATESIKLAEAIEGAQLALIDGDNPFGSPDQGVAAVKSFLAKVPSKRVSGLEQLSARELEVLRLLSIGRSNREIAQELVLSERTIERHVANIYVKIGLRNRSEATAFALSNLSLASR